MYDFSGNYQHTLDAKGRISVPAAYKEALSGEFVVALNNEFNAIAIYTVESWEEISRVIDAIPYSDARAMSYVRLMKANSFPGQRLDAQGRLSIPSALRQKAGLNRNARFVGVGKYIEIWDEERFAATFATYENQIVNTLTYVNDKYF